MLEFASGELRSNRRVVLEAVRHQGLALKWASEELRRDRQVVLAALEPDTDGLVFSRVPLDREIVQKTLEHPRFADPGCMTDEEVTTMMLKRSSYGQMMARWATQRVPGWDRVSFPELHARFISMPVTEEDPEFRDLGWRFREELEEESSIPAPFYEKESVVVRSNRRNKTLVGRSGSF
eukprot:scaffold1018_cov241-Pinguiococcus_pyrenoidosus.AAC.5